MRFFQKLLNEFTWKFQKGVKVHSHQLREISERSEWNSIFHNQKIEVIYKNSSSVDTWAKVMKQKLNCS